MKPKKRNSKETERIKLLEKQLKETQKALRESEFKNKLLDEMINIAETEYDVPVRKNPPWSGLVPGYHKSKPARALSSCKLTLPAGWDH